MKVTPEGRSANWLKGCLKENTRKLSSKTPVISNRRLLACSRALHVAGGCAQHSNIGFLRSIPGHLSPERAREACPGALYAWPWGESGKVSLLNPQMLLSPIGAFAGPGIRRELSGPD